jgi:putative ABC transport system ATP-binding protein
MDTKPAISIQHARFSWQLQSSYRLKIDRFNVQPGERLLLTGRSGSGKSTLLSLICGANLPQSGQVEILGQELSQLSISERDHFRAEHIGVVFQMFNLISYMSIVDNVLLPLSFAPERKKRARQSGPLHAKAEHLLISMGLEPSAFRTQSVAELSVGQQQRVALARALIGAPQIIIADEPTSALDSDRQEQFLDLIMNQAKAEGTTLLIASHDRHLSSRFDRVLDMSEIASTDGEEA